MRSDPSCFTRELDTRIEIIDGDDRLVGDGRCVF